MTCPFLYHFAAVLKESHDLTMAITRKELSDAHFELLSPPVAWEQFAVNEDTLVVLARFGGHPRVGCGLWKGVHMAKGTRYPAEFRAEAIRLYRTAGRSHRELASELGIALETLRRCVSQTDIDAGSRNGSLRRSGRSCASSVGRTESSGRSWTS